MSQATEKYRYFAFIVYPESAPADWQQQLEDSHGEYAISPLHTPDGEDAKPHHHVLYCHGAPTTPAAARRAIPETVPANGCIEPVPAPRGYQRYLIHLDNPDKQQFADGSNAITVLGGFPLDLSKDMSKAERDALRGKLFSLMREQGICEYADLLDGLQDMGAADLFDYAFNHTIAISRYLDSVRHSRAE